MHFFRTIYTSDFVHRFVVVCLLIAFSFGCVHLQVSHSGGSEVVASDNTRTHTLTQTNFLCMISFLSLAAAHENPHHFVFLMNFNINLKSQKAKPTIMKYFFSNVNS